MATKTWARLEAGAVAELLTLDEANVPGEHIPALWTDDVTADAGIAVGWVKANDGTFAAPVPPAPTTGDLLAYANRQQWLVATGGYTATIAGEQVTFSTDPTSFSLITGKAIRFQQPDAPASVDWQTSPTTFVTIGATDFITAATRIADFMQATFDALRSVQAAITANPPTVTTTAQIDAAFAAVAA